MPACTYISDSEVDPMKKVLDNELNELFQEVNLKFPDKYFLSEHEVFRKRNGFWRKMKGEIRYTMYVRIENKNMKRGHTFEYQVFNFPPENGSSINSSGSKDHVMMYFFGLLNGSKNNV